MPKPSRSLEAEKQDREIRHGLQNQPDLQFARWLDPSSRALKISQIITQTLLNDRLLVAFQDKWSSCSIFRSLRDNGCYLGTTRHRRCLQNWLCPSCRARVSYDTRNIKALFASTPRAVQQKHFPPETMRNCRVWTALDVLQEREASLCVDGEGLWAACNGYAQATVSVGRCCRWRLSNAEAIRECTASKNNKMKNKRCCKPTMKGKVSKSVDLKSHSGKNPAKNPLKSWQNQESVFSFNLVPPGPPDEIFGSFYWLVSQHLEEGITTNGATS